MDKYTQIDTMRIIILGVSIMGTALVAKVWLFRVIRKASAEVKARQDAEAKAAPDNDMDKTEG